ATRPRKIERRAGPGGGFDAAGAAEALDGLLHDGQPHPAPLHLVARAERLEEAEDALVVRPRDAGAVVGHSEPDDLRRGAGPHVDGPYGEATVGAVGALEGGGQAVPEVELERGAVRRQRGEVALDLERERVRGVDSLDDGLDEGGGVAVL